MAKNEYNSEKELVNNLKKYLDLNINKDLKNQLKNLIENYDDNNNDILILLNNIIGASINNNKELFETKKEISKKLDDANQIIKELSKNSEIQTYEDVINSFNKSVCTQKNKFEKEKRRYTFSFFASIVIIIILLNVNLYYPVLQADWGTFLGYRLSIIFPGLAIISFIYSNYKISRIHYLRYSHICDLISSGYQFFEYVLDDKKLTSEYIQKILDGFLQLSDLQKVIEQEKEPTIKYFNIIMNSIKKINEKLDK